MQGCVLDRDACDAKVKLASGRFTRHAHSESSINIFFDDPHAQILLTRLSRCGGPKFACSARLACAGEARRREQSDFSSSSALVVRFLALIFTLSFLAGQRDHSVSRARPTSGVGLSASRDVSVHTPSPTHAAPSLERPGLRQTKCFWTLFTSFGKVSGHCIALDPAEQPPISRADECPRGPLSG